MTPPPDSPEPPRRHRDATIGRRLRAARGRLGWSREALAFHSGLSWSAIAQIETGRRSNVRPATLALLADALGVTVDYLLGRERHEPSMLEHHALLYANDDEFLEAAAPFVAEGVERSEATIAVTTAPRVRLLREQLGGDAAGVTFVEARRLYTTPVAALHSYNAFIDQQLEAGAAWIRILGEPLWAGLTDAEVAVWTRYESLVNLAFATTPVSVMCPYSVAHLDDAIVEQAHATHKHMHVEGEVTASSRYTDPGEFALEH